MNYELAKELKDAGYPQDRGNQWIDHHGFIVGVDEWDVGMIIYPTLSELIESCGERFGYLAPLRDPETGKINGWVAKDFDKPTTLGQYEHKIRRGAVSKLWMAVQKQ